MKLTHRQGDPAGLKLLEENARFMPYDVYQALVAQVRKDGVLQQWPFVYFDKKSGVRTVLSGNHRVQAAMEAGLAQIDWTECDEPLSRDEQLRIQLAHNAVVGEDDPVVLARIYASIEDVEEKLATGLDDAALALMFKTATDGMAEARLDFTSLQIVFLPEEYERAEDALIEARKLSPGDRTWLARLDQHNGVLQALEDARESAHVINAAAGMDILLDVWDAHRTDLQGNWLTEHGELRGNGRDPVPTTSLFGVAVSAADGQIIAKALTKMKARSEIDKPAEALASWARAYLTSRGDL